MIAVLMSCFC